MAAEAITKAAVAVYVIWQEVKKEKNIKKSSVMIFKNKPRRSVKKKEKNVIKIKSLECL